MTRFDYPFHKTMFSHTDSSFGGQFKNVQNYISAADGAGNRLVLFTPLAPYETADAMPTIWQLAMEVLTRCC